MAKMVVRKPRMRADDIFFPAMACLILAIVVTGFGRSYFLAGMMFARLPNRLVHIHGAGFVLWIFLLVAQPWLVSAQKLKMAHETRIPVHRAPSCYVHSGHFDAAGFHSPRA